MTRYDHPDPRLVAPCADWAKRGMRRENARLWELSPEWQAAHFGALEWNCDSLHFAIFGGAF